ncbi:MAG: iron-sulfur cluster assembly scaffold protein [Alphaproteobacteria bacterium RIFCSPHIGHO2_12_FULL_63_12]|nr:MAG: iron-sulfur cluster assembly scaffold protein [Alphaproteobacteria bacterium RIFCSPHIGHO2_12_FULL_63_12]
MLSDLYSGKILEAAAAIPPARRLSSPDASATKTSRVCGSQVSVDLVMKGGVVAEFGMEAKACALGQASASILARNIIGATAEEIYALRDAMRAMLKDGGDPPAGARWSEMESLIAIRDYPQRHASTMLAIEAACACLDALELRPNGAVAKA